MNTGGTDRNEQLTATVGALLLVLLAVLGITIIRIGQLIWLHLFLGLLLVGPVMLKLASTGYRFARYYTGDPAYRRKGPPQLALRLLAPLVVLCTGVVFVSGVILLFHGPQNRGLWLTIHKVSFIVWLVFTAVHVLGHLPGLGGSLRPRASGPSDTWRGEAGRWIAVSSRVQSDWCWRSCSSPISRCGRATAPSATITAEPSAAQRAYSIARDSRITVTLI